MSPLGHIVERCGEIVCMKNNDYGLLYDAAVAWKELTEYLKQ